MTPAHQYCSFLLDGLLFGIGSHEIQEVVTYRELRPVPLAPRAVAGLINLRGQVLVALDLRRQLELPERPVDMLPVGLVVRSAGETICLLADEAGGVVEAGDLSLELLSLPGTFSPRLRRLILGICQLESRLMHVLDTEQVCAVEALQ